MRDASVKSLTETLEIRTRGWRETDLTALRDFAVVPGFVPKVRSWNSDEKEQLVRIIQAKAGRDEATYLKLMQQHARLRTEMIRLGS